MTKRRAPVTIENALLKVLGVVTLDRAAAATDRTAGYLHSLTDPDKRFDLTVRDALILDVEYQAAGGLGAPIHETCGLLLQAARAERFGDAEAIRRQAVHVIREGGEAQAALVVCASPAATDADRATAARELEEAISALTEGLRLLKSGPSP